MDLLLHRNQENHRGLINYAGIKKIDMDLRNKLTMQESKIIMDLLLLRNQQINMDLLNLITVIIHTPPFQGKNQLLEPLAAYFYEY